MSAFVANVRLYVEKQRQRETTCSLGVPGESCRLGQEISVHGEEGLLSIGSFEMNCALLVKWTKAGGSCSGR